MATSSSSCGGTAAALRRHPPSTTAASGCSTAHANLLRILAVISSQVVPPPTSLLSGLDFSADLCHVQALDLSLRLGPVLPLEITVSKVEEEGRGRSIPSACSAVVAGKPQGVTSTAAAATCSTKTESIVVSKSAEKATPPPPPSPPVSNSYTVNSEKSSEGECEVRDQVAAVATDEEDEGGRQQGKEYCYSEITNVAVKAGAGAEEEETDINKGVFKTRGGVQPQGTGSNGPKGEGHLVLLLEAVRQVTGGTFGEEEEEEATCIATGKEQAVEEAEDRSRRPLRSKRGSCWSAMDLYGVEEDYSSPIVRSKRGRNQVLPSRYRDSVLEPWGKPPTLGGGRNYRFHHRTARTGQ